MRPTTALEIDGERHVSTNGSRPSDSERRAAAIADLKDSLKELLRSALRATTGIALDQVEDLAGTFDRTAAAGGLAVGGLLGGVRAGMQGRNAVWGAFKGVIGALSPRMRVALVGILLLAILLLPITVVLLLVALIVLVVVAAANASS
ncbi:MAG: hypothetical protein J0I34_01190 [Pseudonocardia sp.]|uniref:hypothetical protein n=1 Tax=unclassified Pseudonocardia TaxID=2619320 RepID=UPI00086A2147|nr:MULTISPECIES: hypothetical protein [unclassified Pseudonocardia]MBN9107370.1 hypothetical protein [Pseudonocardia sp.]ODU26662.1 MAG: hypothetical protein ABS80_06565 [Pseudonocardia sp. SCN 72-51]ODV06607.1 MAG: hypothetical protein ABT15_12365 [Pseudonocardia sp. SCN 73-27]